MISPTPKHPARPGDSITLRGGRLRKSRRGILTFAPWLGRLIAAAPLAPLAVAATGAVLATSFLLPSDSHAQTVVPDNTCTFYTDIDTYRCRGMFTETFDRAKPGPITIVDADGAMTNFSSANNNAVILKANGGSLVVNLKGNLTAPKGTALHTTSSRTTSITLAGAITGETGVYAQTAGSGFIHINTLGNITATETAIQARSRGGSITIDTKGRVSGATGIYANNRGGTRTNDTLITVDNQTIATSGTAVRALAHGHLNISSSATARGSISGSTGIEAFSSSNHNITIDLAGGGVVRGTRQTGIHARIDGATNYTSNIDITTARPVDGRTGIHAELAHRGSASGNIIVTTTAPINGFFGPAIAFHRSNAPAAGAVTKLIFQPGGSVSAGDSVTFNHSGAILALDAPRRFSAADSFNLAELAHWTGFTEFEKTGVGTWTATGIQPSDKGFTAAHIRAGTLHLQDSADLRASTFTIHPGATVLVGHQAKIRGDVVNTGTLAVSGTISLDGIGNIDNANGAVTLSSPDDLDADDWLLVTDFTTGGTLTMDIALVPTGTEGRLTADGDDFHDLLTITGTGMGTAPTAVVLNIRGSINDFDAAGLTLIDFVGITSTVSLQNAFTLNAADVAEGFALTRDNTTGDWNLTHTPPPQRLRRHR